MWPFKHARVAAAAAPRHEPGGARRHSEKRCARPGCLRPRQVPRDRPPDSSRSRHHHSKRGKMTRRMSRKLKYSPGVGNIRKGVQICTGICSCLFQLLYIYHICTCHHHIRVSRICATNAGRRGERNGGRPREEDRCLQDRVGLRHKLVTCERVRRVVAGRRAAACIACTASAERAPAVRPPDAAAASGHMSRAATGSPRTKMGRPCWEVTVLGRTSGRIKAGSRRECATFARQ